MITLFMAAAVTAQVSYKFEEEDFLLNRATGSDSLNSKTELAYETTSNHFKTFKLMHKFINEINWQERSQVVVGYDHKGNLVEVTVKSQPVELKEKFESAC